MPTENKIAAPEFDLNDADGGRDYIAHLFKTVLKRHDYRQYITERLAGDFACTLAQHFEGIKAREAALQQRLTAADERVDVLEGLSVKQAALLEELGIPLDEVDDLFGETLKNSKRYEYLRSVMAVENFPAPHPTWSEPSEFESKRIDDLCDDALKPAETSDDTCEFCKGWGFSSNSDGADEGCGACNGTGKEPEEGGGDGK